MGILDRDTLQGQSGVMGIKMAPTLRWLVSQQERRGSRRLPLCIKLLPTFFLENAATQVVLVLKATCFINIAVQQKINVTLNKHLMGMYDRCNIERAAFPDISKYTHSLIMHTDTLSFTVSLCPAGSNQSWDQRNISDYRVSPALCRKTTRKS